MRSYLILNGNNSLNIRGLLIQNLPPISKPKIRTQIETIDGRDGDNVTYLGYSSYEKSFQIGLYDNFDIDEIIAFFNTSGIVVFSNEPDKYYNYQIVEQIDFNRLVRFRTATVKMHVQPFKYSAEDNSKVFQVATNLFNKDNFQKLNAYFNGAITKITENQYNRLLYIPCSPNTTYTISKIKSTTFSVGYTDEVPAVGVEVNSIIVNGNISNNRSYATITTGPNARYLVVRYYHTNNDTGVTEQQVIDSIQIVVGNEMFLNQVEIRNAGNIYSKPKLIITGSGNIGISLNGVQLFQISLGTLGSITIDTNLMEAYNSGTLLNRLVTGNYDNFKLNIGKNIINWTGSVTQIEIENYSRWI